MSSEQILSQGFAKGHPTDVAKSLETLRAAEVAAFFETVRPDLAAKILQLMLSFKAVTVLDALAADKTAEIIAEMPIEHAAVLLGRLKPKKRSVIFDKLPEPISKSLGLLLHYPEDTAGSLMNPQTFSLFDDLTAKEALALILKNPKHLYYHIPVTDRGHRFLGMTDTRELMLAEPDRHVSALTHAGVGQLSPTLSKQGILAHPDWQLYHELPVVDENGLFLGVIDYQTLRRLELEAQANLAGGPAHDAGRVLGELYWIGLSAFFKGAASIVTREEEPKGPDKGGS